MKFGFIGTGVMAGAMLKSALNHGFFNPEEVIVYDSSRAASESFGVKIAQSANELTALCDVVQIGVKPQDQPALLAQIADELRNTKPLLISIAAGVPLSRLSCFSRRVVRLMPNINTTVDQGMTAYCATEQVSQEELAMIKRYCDCFGKSVALEESKFSAFVALAGSAPAFVFLFLDELARAGVSAGLPKTLALKIASQTVLGSAMQVEQSGLHPYELIDRVCSPGGTTIMGINALREHGFAHAVSQAVLAASRRDQELGR